MYAYVHIHIAIKLEPIRESSLSAKNVIISEITI